MQLGAGHGGSEQWAVGSGPLGASPSFAETAATLSLPPSRVSIRGGSVVLVLELVLVLVCSLRA